MGINDPFRNKNAAVDGGGSRQETKSPVIRIAEDRDVLVAKLAEYKKRLEDNSYKPPWAQWDTVYKIAVVEELLEHGEVNTYELSRKLAEQAGGVFDVGAFNNACAVIQDYITTGGKDVIGGTGLPKKPQE